MRSRRNDYDFSGFELIQQGQLDMLKNHLENNVNTHAVQKSTAYNGVMAALQQLAPQAAQQLAANAR